MMFIRQDLIFPLKKNSRGCAKFLNASEPKRCHSAQVANWFNGRREGGGAITTARRGRLTVESQAGRQPKRQPLGFLQLSGWNCSAGGAQRFYPSKASLSIVTYLVRSTCTTHTGLPIIICMRWTPTHNIQWRGLASLWMMRSLLSERHIIWAAHLLMLLILAECVKEESLFWSCTSTASTFSRAPTESENLTASGWSCWVIALIAPLVLKARVSLWAHFCVFILKGGFDARGLFFRLVCSGCHSPVKWIMRTGSFFSWWFYEYAEWMPSSIN